MREWTEKLAPITQEEIKPIDYKEINQKIWLNNIDVHQAPVLTISAWCHNHIKALHKKYPWTEWTAICRIVNHWDWQFEMVDMIHPWRRPELPGRSPNACHMPITPRHHELLPGPPVSTHRASSVYLMLLGQSVSTGSDAPCPVGANIPVVSGEIDRKSVV